MPSVFGYRILGVFIEKITVTPDGFSVNGRHYAWDDIQRVIVARGNLSRCGEDLFFRLKIFFDNKKLVLSSQNLSCRSEKDTPCLSITPAYGKLEEIILKNVSKAKIKNIDTGPLDIAELPRLFLILLFFYSIIFIVFLFSTHMF